MKNDNGLVNLRRKKLKSKKIQSKGGLLNLRYSPSEIDKKVKAIYSKILSYSKNLDSGNFKSFSTDDLRHLFELYDRYFFNNFFTKNYGDTIFFRLSNRMTRASGKTTYWKNNKTYEICLSTVLMFQSFGDVRRKIKVSGIVCHDRIEAVMRVLEHEIIHLVERVLFETSSCFKPQFKQFSRNVFNHSDVTHQLVSHYERADKIFDLRVGNRVSFIVNGEMYIGLLTRITKRATVMVAAPDGPLVDSNGKRHSKYYVPLPLLKPVKRQPV